MKVDPRLRAQQMRVITTHFSPAIVTWANENFSDYDEYDTSVSQLVLGQAIDLIPASIRGRVPTSVDDFNWAIGPIFNANTTLHVVPQMDGSSSMFHVPGHKTVQQVTLTGTTILDAWVANPVTAKLSCLKNGPLRHDSANLSQIWTPNTAGNNFVYHGTAAQYGNNGWADQLTQTPFDAIGAYTNPSQMAPEIVPGVFTAMSPLRAYLWAAFKDRIPRMEPSPEQLGRLQQSWICGRDTYRGLVLFQFYGTQPAPSGLTHYTIPIGTEKAWGDLSQGAALKSGLTTAWGRFTGFHGQGDGVWPDVTHGLEYEPQRSYLGPFHTNMWRTMRKGEQATEHLKSQHAATFAIEFYHTQPLKPAPTQAANTQTPKDDGDDGQGKGKDKKGGMRKKLSKRVSTFFDSMRPSSQGSAR
ncbi:hypothetical protein CSOJ01_05660 [Colletotrichum sojae]|uniref:Uncharacterized protein n=1 Tax=Colletotrichum sojae TaxID=2175907 RepID=A0A8H6JEB9_9PEZI|nr:hypothetical protein CSOJ01_05660 [Colletotrichum sojae]